MEQFVDLCQPRTKLFAFELEQSFPRLGGISFGVQVIVLLRQKFVLRFALTLFRCYAVDLAASE